MPLDRIEFMFRGCWIAYYRIVDNGEIKRNLRLTIEGECRGNAR